MCVCVSKRKREGERERERNALPSVTVPFLKTLLKFRNFFAAVSCITIRYDNYL